MKFLMMSFLFVLISCGTDTTSTGSSSSTSSTYSTAVTAASSTALTNVLTWYQSTTEPANFTGTVFRTEYRVVKVYPSTNCGTNSSSVYVCNVSGYPSSSTVSSQSVMPTQSGAVKTSLALVSSILSGSLGTIVNVTTSTSNTGGVFYAIYLVKSSGYSAVYTIDTGINSAFNPVYIFDSETRTETTLYQII